MNDQHRQSDTEADPAMAPLKKIAITGSSGAYGRGLVAALHKRHPDATVLGLDIAAPKWDVPTKFVKCDIVDEEIIKVLCDFAPDTIIHLAYVVDPIHDDALMERVNMGGTRNVLEAARRCKPARLLISSSATAYGAWPDNPVPMEEDAPIRARPEFRYAADKAAIEGLISDFAAERPDIAVSWTRPSIFYGPGINNFLTRFIINAKLIAIPDGHATPMQFVHINDVVGATLTILEHDARGPFNVSPPDWVTARQIAHLTRRKCIPVPLALCRAFSVVWWHLRLPWFQFPSSLWYFIRYPWVVTPKRLTDELGFKFRRTSLETLELLLADAGQLRAPLSPRPATDHAVHGLTGAASRQSSHIAEG